MGFLNQILSPVSGLGNAIYRSCEGGVGRTPRQCGDHRRGWGEGGVELGRVWGRRGGGAGQDRVVGGFGERVAGDGVDDYCWLADVEEWIAVSRVVVSRVRGKY